MRKTLPHSPLHSNRLYILGLLSISVIILCIVMPNLLFSNNTEYIPQAVTYSRYFFIASIGSFCVLAVILLLLPYSLARTFAILLASYTISVLIFDIISPLDIGPLERGTETLKISLTAGMLQLSLFIFVFFITLYTPTKTIWSITWPVALVLTCLNTPFLFSHTDHIKKPADTDLSTAIKRPDFNIYHFIFDAYYGPWLQWSLAALDKDKDEFKGFIHYRRCVSNYGSTAYSYPSLMSGTLFSSEMTISEWQESADENSIVQDLHDRGFTSSFYGTANFRGTRLIHDINTADPAGVGIAGFALASDYWLLRIAPVITRHMILDQYGNGPCSRILNHFSPTAHGEIRALVSYRQFKQFISDEKLRPSEGQYVHVHIVPPHPPYQLDRNGKYIGASSYSEQILLATNMMIQIIKTLKEQDKFNRSLIIFHADHGSGDDILHKNKHHAFYIDDPLRNLIQMTPSLSQQIMQRYTKRDTRTNKHRKHPTLENDEDTWERRQLRGVYLEARHQPLLLIKPRGTHQEKSPFIINDSLVQLCDLRNFIQEAVDSGVTKYPERDAVSIFILKHAFLGAEPYGIYDQHIKHPNGVWEMGAETTVRY